MASERRFINDEQLALIATMKAGVSYVDYHIQFHQRIAKLLQGYLILFATHAFVPQRQLRPSRPPSPLVFLPISTHFTATPGIPPASTSLKTHILGDTTHIVVGSVEILYLVFNGTLHCRNVLCRPWQTAGVPA